MAAIDIEQLLAPVSDEAPTGENLEYDAGFSELEREAAGKEERYSGGELIPAEDPDWKEVRRLAIELFGRTKDLRVAVHLARAETSLEGIPGLASGISLLRAMLERHWDDVHPKLEPDDENDPIFRINALAPLGDPAGLLGCLRKAVLVAHRAVGRFTFRDLDIAEERATAPEGESSPTIEVLRGTLGELGSEYAETHAALLQQVRDDLEAINAVFREKAASGQTPDLEALDSAVEYGRAFLASGVAGAAAAEGDSAEASADGDAPGRAAGDGGGGGGGAGPLRNREDVKRLLDQICDFLQRTEPSNPAPLLIRRARRLVDMNFMDIIGDLAPDALSQIERLAGTEASGSSE
jgi:type VI secretion system protein ImpA